MTITRACILSLSLLCINVLAQTWQPERIVGLEYPKAALVRGLEGTVEIECYIANDGSVARAEPISGQGDLASAAIRNAMHWKFRRITSGNDRYTLVYRFRIRRIPKPSELHTFRFVMPGQVFITAEKSTSERKTLCEIFRDPQKYAGRMVRLEARFFGGLHGQELVDDKCREQVVGGKKVPPAIDVITPSEKQAGEPPVAFAGESKSRCRNREQSHDSGTLPEQTGAV